MPPDGVIAARFADMQDGIKRDLRRYLRDCLLKGMRGEAFPRPMAAYKLSAIDAVWVRQRAAELLPAIEPVRAGEVPLPADPVQEALAF